MKPDLSILTASPEETERFGERLGELLKPGDVVCLSGTLGAGKTCMTRGIARGWGTPAQVTSPTFTLINEYQHADSSQRLFHMDSYRLSGAVEAQTTALDDVLDAEGVVVIEWAERIKEALPPDVLWLVIEAEDEASRRIHLTGTGERSEQIIAGLSE